MRFLDNFSDTFYRRAIPILIVIIILSSLVVVAGVAILIQRDFKETSKIALPFPIFNNETEQEEIDLTAQTAGLTVNLKQAGEYIVPENYSPPSPLPLFATYDEVSRKLLINATDKSHIGSYDIVLVPNDSERVPPLTLKLVVDLPAVDLLAMEAEIMKIIGTGNPNMGIYVEDLVRGKIYTYNASHVYKPGSISKLPVGFVTLKDLQSGKFTLNSTYPIYNQYKHTYVDAIGKLPVGTKVTIDTYLKELYKLSNNSAQYHLREMIGNFSQAPGVWSSGVLNQRVQQELGVYQWAEDPHIVTALDIGKVWREIYQGKTYEEQWKNYFFDTLGAAAPSLKEAIPAGVPAGIRVVNKVGFLYGSKDNTYSDCGIVFGNNTNYLIAVLNNAAPPYPQGKNIIKAVSAVVYKHLDANL